MKILCDECVPLPLTKEIRKIACVDSVKEIGLSAEPDDRVLLRLRNMTCL